MRHACRRSLAGSRVSSALNCILGSWRTSDFDSALHLASGKMRQADYERLRMSKIALRDDTRPAPTCGRLRPPSLTATETRGYISP